MNPPTDRTEFNRMPEPKRRKPKLRDVLAAFAWFRLFWIVQLICFLMLFFGLAVFIPASNQYYSVFAAALAVLMFSWAAVALAWDRAMSILSRI
jgi:hypothetical protein